MSILGWSDRSLEHSSKQVSRSSAAKVTIQKVQYPDPTVPPPTATHSKPPACINHYCPQANTKITKLMSNVGLGSSIGIMGGNAGLCYIEGCPLQFPVRPNPTSPPPPKCSGWFHPAGLHSVLLKQWRLRVLHLLSLNYVQLNYLAFESLINRWLNS